MTNKKTIDDLLKEFQRRHDYEAAKELKNCNDYVKGTNRGLVQAYKDCIKYIESNRTALEKGIGNYNRCANCGIHADDAGSCIQYGEEWVCSIRCGDQHDELGCPHETHDGYRHPVETEELIILKVGMPQPLKNFETLRTEWVEVRNKSIQAIANLEQPQPTGDIGELLDKVREYEQGYSDKDHTRWLFDDDASCGLMDLLIDFRTATAELQNVNARYETLLDGLDINIRAHSSPRTRLELTEGALTELQKENKRLAWLRIEGNYCKKNDNTASPNYGKWYAGNKNVILSIFHDTFDAAIDRALEQEKRS